MEDKNSKLSICVLISCMNQDMSIIERAHVQTNVVVVNQCDVEDVMDWDFENAKGQKCHAKFISTKERGLSRSRNMAIRNAIGDICLISDDDEELVDGYEDIINDAYSMQPNADLISFAFDRRDKSFPAFPAKHTLRSLLKTSSVEITFRIDVIIKKRICFDVKMGSGSGNGAGEENMFLITCRRNGLQMYYSPQIIGRLLSMDSLWFKGFTATYFENFGWASRRILGGITSLVYLVYWIPTHRGLYNREISSWDATKSYLRGWRSKR